ncbi:hypothetical protein [Paenibacillus rhizophilus]|uniref:Uncharacterized protein n=1 Tax=Paenibacillus rhizophilus TaxID=1850366 RepID=A0A3N9Q2F7_9BACL|nr:hypothetical protein [Paenibacillus rhizophilus]RQW12902.1 hypothetical protein EH198_00265 [Paenibacillus rhizophilus]
MNRLTSRTPLLYTLGFLFCLIFAFAVFFTGVKVGADKVEGKYEKIMAAEQSAKSYTSYRQTDLVTFYHNVFSPYREFKRNWNEKVGRLAGGAEDSSDVLKSLRSLADSAYAQVNQASLFTDSPLLERGQLNILKSLRLFSEAANQASAASGGAQAAKTLKSGELAAGAIKYGLLGQSNYYTSMLKWGSQANSSIPSETGNPKVISIGEWKKMPLLLKNAAIADILLNRSVFADYDPQDVTAKIDNLINSGMAASLKLQSIQSATSLLVSTDAFGERDFSKWRLQYYGKETLPELPFFYD